MRSDHLKWLVAGSVIAYLFFKFKEGKDDGQIAGIDFDTNKIVDSAMPWLNVNPTIKPIASQLAKKALGSIVGFKKDDAINAQFRRVK